MGVNGGWEAGTALEMGLEELYNDRVKPGAPCPRCTLPDFQVATVCRSSTQIAVAALDHTVTTL